MAQLQALPAYEGYAGIKSSTGVITPPSKYKGVPLTDLADLVGGISEANGVTIVAKDGYGMTFSYRQIAGDGFTTFDPATGEEEPADGELTVLVAYAHEGEPIPEDDGPLKLAIAQDTPAQVTKGHWAIKWLEGVSVTKASAAWKVQLQGAVPGELDPRLLRQLRLAGPATAPAGSTGRAGAGRASRSTSWPAWSTTGRSTTPAPTTPSSRSRATTSRSRRTPARS